MKTERADKDHLPFALIARRLKAMADPSRLAVLHSLCEGERCVTELMRATNFSQTNVSKHLRVLKQEGLVVGRRNHRNVFYSVSSGVPEEICELICRSMQKRASDERSVLERYLVRRRAHEAG